jgi:hypothetical protein
MQKKEGSGCRRAEPFDPTLPRLPVLIAGRLAKEVEVFLRGPAKRSAEYYVGLSELRSFLKARGSRKLVAMRGLLPLI